MKTKIISEEQKKSYAKVLKEKGALDSCIRCYNNEFVIAPAYFAHPLHYCHINKNKIEKVEQRDASLMSIALICTNCGFIMHHTVGALNLSSANDNQE